MRKNRLTKKNVDILTAQEQMSHLLKKVRSGDSRIIIEEDDAPVAAIVSVQDLEMLEFYEQKRAERFEILKEIGEAFKDIPPEELEREVTRAIAEVRATASKDSQRDALAS